MLGLVLDLGLEYAIFCLEFSSGLKPGQQLVKSLGNELFCIFFILRTLLKTIAVSFHHCTTANDHTEPTFYRSSFLFPSGFPVNSRTASTCNTEHC